MQGDATSPALRRDRDTISLTEGGPFYRLLMRLHLRTPTSMARCWSLGILIWIPLVVGEGIDVLAGARLDPMLRDLSLHVRLLFALPLLLTSELLLEQTARSSMTSMYRGNYCDRAALDRIVERAERLRDSWVVELVLLAIAILGGQLVLWRVFGSTGLFHGGEAVAYWSFPRVWHAIVALPLVQFVMFRWLWRWVIWNHVIARISRLPLFVLATHADSAGGLSALSRPVNGFSAFVLASGAILSAAWGTQLIAQRTTLAQLLPLVVTFLMTALVVAVGPLLLLSGHLFRARRRTLAQYGDFMRSYTLRFHRRWIEPPPSEDDVKSPLGSPDIQSLSDLGNAYQVASKTRMFVFGPRNVLAVWFAGFLPMFPLLWSTLTVEQVLKRIITTVLSGLPV